MLLGSLVLTGLTGCGSEPSATPELAAAETERQDAAVITRDNGAPCEDNEVCESGYCIDGVCCATECTGTCMACNESLTGSSSGVCLAVSVDTDPDNECDPMARRVDSTASVVACSLALGTRVPAVS